MNIIALVAVAIVASIISVMIKKYNPEYSMLISIVAGVFILYMVISELNPAINKINNLISSSGISFEHAKVLFKALGVCFLVQFASDSCNDAGENALASKIDLAGKVIVIGLSLPLFEEVIKIVSGLLGG